MMKLSGGGAWVRVPDSFFLLNPNRLFIVKSEWFTVDLCMEYYNVLVIKKAYGMLDMNLTLLRKIDIKID